MEIIISENKRIVSNNKNWSYQEKKVIEKGDNKGQETWYPKWFYINLQHCYFDLLEYFTKISDRETLKEAFDETIIKLEAIKKQLK